MLHEGWPFTVIQTANTAYNPEFNTTPKRFRPNAINPDPQIPQWPKPEWPKELQDLCKEFSDVLMEELEEAQNITCPPMDTSKPFFARKPKKHPLHWAEKVKKRSRNLSRQG